jgi:hypothetical protein
MAILAFMVPLMGATGADGCSSTPPKACNVASCTTGQVLICGDLCVTPIAVGQPCSLDLCAPSGTCADGATCIPTGSGNNGTCTKIPSVGGDPGSATTVGVSCAINTSASGVSYDTCANDLYCRNLSNCAPQAAVNLGPARCAVPIPEGGLCDSEFPGYNANVNCSPCAPGLSCKRTTLNDSNRCVRDCTTNNDCPCPGGQNGTCETISTGEKACTTCAPLGQACDGYRKCCGSGEQCGTSNNGSPDLCCRSPGAPCDTQSDCCGASSGSPIVCATSGGNKTCTACKKAGVACTSSDQCCKGGACTGGFCRVSCTSGGSCSTSLKGACKAGHYECDPFGNQSCVSNNSPTASDTTCDGVDNDCDGKVDDNVPSPMSDCTTTLTAAQCGYPTDVEAKGQKVCKNGQEVCEVKAGVSYCTSASGGPCGRPFGEPCDAQNKCGIGLVCATTPNGPRCNNPTPTCFPAGLGCYPLNSPYLGGCLP